SGSKKTVERQRVWRYFIDVMMMISRLAHPPPLPLVLGLLALSSCGTGEPVVCGDGAVVGSPEQCDDGSKVDDDGCTSDCEPETAGPMCPTVFESPGRSRVRSVLAADDGRLWVAGYTGGRELGERVWVGAFDGEGLQHWRIDLEGGLSAVRRVDG